MQQEHFKIGKRVLITTNMEPGNDEPFFDEQLIGKTGLIKDIDAERGFLDLELMPGMPTVPVFPEMVQPLTGASDMAQKSTSNDVDMQQCLQEFKNVKQRFSDLGKLAPKLKGIKDRGVKDKIRGEFDLESKKLMQSLHIIKTKIRNAGADDALMEIFVFERRRRIIDVADEYTLNAHEESKITDLCECFQVAPVGIRATLGATYKYKKDYDEARETDVYTFYIPVTVEPKDRMGKQLERKIDMGYMPEEKDYPPEAVFVRRNQLVEGEFKRYFRETI